MQHAVDNLPDDPTTLKRLLLESQIHLEAERSELKRFRHEVSNLKNEVSHYQELLRLARHRAFAPSSERHIHPGQMAIFNEAEDLASTISSKPSTKKSKDKNKPKRAPIDASLSREVYRYDIDANEKVCCGKSMDYLGEVSSEQVDIIPARVFVRKHTRLKYVCRCCEKIKTAPMPKQPIPKSLAAPGLLAAIAVNKYADGMPLYRQESILRRAGIELRRNTVAEWMIKLAEVFRPLFNLMQDDLLSRNLIQADETTVQVLREKGRTPKQKSYVWVTASGRFGVDPPIILFHYDPSRGAHVPKRLLEGWSGYLVSDGYGGYTSVAEEQGITLCGCIDHVRRKFKDAIDARKEGEPTGLAEDALWYLSKIYDVERREKDAGHVRRKVARSLYSYSIFSHFRKWLDRVIDSVRPSSPTGQALGYLNRQWPKLVHVLESGEIPVSNELCENAIRPFVVGRKAWLFSASSAGAEASCAIYSLIETAKANGHDPYAYLHHVIERLPACETVEDYTALLPYVLVAKQTQHV